MSAGSRIALASGLALVAAGLYFVRSRSPRAAPSVAPEAQGPAAPAEEALHAAETPRAPSLPRRSDAARDPAHEPGVAVLHGRVVDESGSGVASIHVELFARGRSCGETWSGDDGSFAFDALEPAPELARASGEPRWRIDSSERVLTDGERVGRTELRFVARLAPSAPFRALLVDARTQEPIPRFPIVVSDDWESEALVSDDAGRVAGSIGFAAGTLRVELDDPTPEQSYYGEIELAVRDPRDEQRIEIPVGPTYRFALELPSGLGPTDLLAMLGAHLEPRFAHSGEGWMAARLREGKEPWVRFHTEQLFGTGPPFALALVSEDGLWFGEAQVDSVVGIQRDPVRVRLEARAALRGRVIDATGAAIGAVMVVLRPLAGGREARAFLHSDLRFHFRGLEPGEYELAAEGEVRSRSVLRVTLEAGRLLERDFVLEPEPSAGAVRGRIRSATGRFPGRGDALLRGVGEREGVWVRTRIDWIDAGEERVGRFAFESLPAGDYVLQYRTGRAFLPVEPRELVVTPPAEGIALLVRDDLPAHPIRFRPRDGASGEPLERFGCWVRPLEGIADFDADASAGEPFGSFAESYPLRWIVYVEGYRPASGTERELALDADGFACEPALERGWGQQVWVCAAKGDAAIEGVRVLADGALAGVSDATGCVLLSLPEPPERLTIDDPHWRIRAGGEIDPESGVFRPESWWAMPIDLEPRD